ncbi:helix-turn-helix domain-containing protein [Pseudonocardia sp. HH130630-07]|uniref:helix-turn-helix domain-containing protein n=1 Tax=Pseudonocardia sp. HH130630-07 TaxID=1690815 RepID=UPI0008151194|nr:helix-turn-helix domain-containing protein [Pseudonocardia sp. HH130630-07]ANY07188.1 hypothetical protein AFB00_13855 [Pseudonocardia sp. HH130630-07]
MIADRPRVRADAAEVLDEAARAAAVHLLRAGARRDPERVRRTEAAALLLGGLLDPASAARRLGPVLAGGTAVLALTTRTGGGSADLPAARVVELTTLHAELRHPDAVCVVEQGAVYVLLPGPAGRETASARELAEAVGRASGTDVVVAVGPWAAGPDRVAAARRVADRVLTALLAARASVRVGTLAELAPQVALRGLGDAVADPELVLDGVAAMLAHDARHGTGYAASLCAWAGAAGDVARAARTLTIHENTLRYRLRRLRELFGIDAADPDQLLVAWLQARVLGDPGLSGSTSG